MSSTINPILSLRPPAKVLCVVGTRPEAIKVAPVIQALSAAPWARCRTVHTGQHRDLVKPILDFFGIRPHVTLDAMRPRQPLPELMARMIDSLRGAIATERPELVLAQGDTASLLAAALASFSLGIPFGHIEAGLRTGKLFAPFPEEANRVVASHLASIHFAPTHTARANLIREGIRPDLIHVTGNTVIDALLQAAGQDQPIGVPLDPKKRLILVTAHRRDCIGEPLCGICEAVKTLHRMFSDVQFLWPVHPNPEIRSGVETLLRGLPRVRLTEPLSYGAFVSAMKRAALDPDGFGRRPGGGPCPGKARPGPACGERAARGYRGRGGAAGRASPPDDRGTDEPAAHGSGRLSVHGSGASALRRRPGCGPDRSGRRRVPRCGAEGPSRRLRSAPTSTR